LNHTTKRVARAALAAALLAGLPAAAHAAVHGPLATIHQFLDAFNRGDIAAAQATNAGDVSIVDEIPPHRWHGAGAFQAWVADLTKASQAAGQTDEHVSFVRSVREQIDGDTAYEVVQVSFTYREHGRPTIEPAQIAVALRDEGGAWIITGWAWAGTVPHRR
jgi:ketosteroid isomerase-like protein